MGRVEYISREHRVKFKRCGITLGKEPFQKGLSVVRDEPFPVQRFQRFTVQPDERNPFVRPDRERQDASETAETETSDARFFSFFSVGAGAELSSSP